jgi:hypothetical protein
MKYIKKFKSFRDSRKNSVNEEFIGTLIKGIRNKLSLQFSKMFGSSGEVDKLVEEYKKEVMVAWQKKRNALLAIGKFQKSIKDGGEENKEQEKKLLTNLKTVGDNYGKERDLIKKKFDIKFGEIVKEEKNEKIKNYINLKKIEMEQDLLKAESEAILTEAGLSEEDIKGNPEIEQIMKSISERIQKSEEAQKQQTVELESGGGELTSFDLEEAKKNPETYEWKDSKFTKDYKFESGEEIKYWKKSGVKDNGDEYSGTTAFIMDSQVDDEDKPLQSGEIRVTLDKDDENNKGFVITKSRIISTKKDNESKDIEKEKEKGDEDKEV